MEIVYKSGSPQALWKPALLPVYLFTGEEDRLKREAVQALAQHVVAPESRDFDLETLDAESATAGAILSAAAQVPFFSEKRLVVVKGMDLWRERAKQSEAEALAEGLERLGDSTCLVLVASAEAEEAKRKTGVSVKLDNAVKKRGAVVFCKALKGEGLVRWIQERAGQEGKRIEPEAAQQLTAAVGEEMLLLEQEILKLASYVGAAPLITARDVGTVVASSPEDVMFTVIDAITQRKTDRALTLLAELNRYDPKTQGVAAKLLALLARQYRMLWQAKFLAEKRVNPRDARQLPPDLLAELPTEAPISQVAFKAGELFSLAKGISWEEITEALELLLLCDLANKGGVTEESDLFRADVGQNLQTLVLLLTGAARARA